jgi:hypothetical protein
VSFQRLTIWHMLFKDDSIRFVPISPSQIKVCYIAIDGAHHLYLLTSFLVVRLVFGKGIDPEGSS